MLKGLVTRQALLVLEFVFVAILVSLLALVAQELNQESADPGPISQPVLSAGAHDFALASVRGRNDYNSIIKGGLFGSAGQFRGPAIPAAPPEPVAPSPEPEQETELPLRLAGTVNSGKSDPRATATIEVREGATRTETFFIGEQIMTNVFLHEVRKAEVVLDNRQTRALELLKRTRKAMQVAARPSRRATPASRRTITSSFANGGLIQLNRADMIDRLENEVAELASTVNVRVVKDDNGKVQGVTTDNIESIALAGELGFKNGDILATINNEPIDSQEKAVEVLRKYQNASIFRVGIIRNGQPQNINYRVR